MELKSFDFRKVGSTGSRAPSLLSFNGAEVFRLQKGVVPQAVIDSIRASMELKSFDFRKAETDFLGDRLLRLQWS